MALEDLQEQLKDTWADLVSRVQANPSFNTLQEKWEQLSPTLQRLIIAGMIFIVGLGIFSIPYGFHSNSTYLVEKFEANRSLLRNLLRAGRLAGDASQNTPNMSVEDVKNQLNGTLATFGLIPEQMAGINNIAADALGGNLAGGGLQQDGLAINLKKLNLKQIQEIGFQLQDIGPAVKLAGVEIEAGKPDPHYFNVVFKLAVYRMPSLSGASDEKGGSTNSDEADTTDPEEDAGE